jgi:CBS domain-containing protein
MPADVQSVQIECAQKAYQLMSHPLFTLAPGDSLAEAAAMFVEYNISGAPVTLPNGSPVGVFTKTDLARCEREKTFPLPSETGDDVPDAAEGRGEVPIKPSADRVEHWMTPEIFTVDPDAELPEITRVMLKNGVHRVFVLDRESERLVGTITTFDLLRLLAHELNPELPRPDDEGR